MMTYCIDSGWRCSHERGRLAREFGVHRSAYYRWLPAVLQWGLDALRPRERRKPQMPNHTPPWVEQRVVAFALGYPGFGPKRIAAELAREQWGGLVLSPNGVWRILRRHGISTRRQRLALVAGTAVPPGPERPPAEGPRHIEASGPGDLVQLDCFSVGRLRWKDVEAQVQSLSSTIDAPFRPGRAEPPGPLGDGPRNAFLSPISLHAVVGEDGE